MSINLSVNQPTTQTTNQNQSAVINVLLGMWIVKFTDDRKDQINHSIDQSVWLSLTILIAGVISNTLERLKNESFFTTRSRVLTTLKKDYLKNIIE